jgi:hypothetical protein
MDVSTIIGLWVLGGLVVGGLIGDRKGRTAVGAVLGLLLGPMGWLIVALGPDYKHATETKKCPFCAEVVKREAVVCKHCGREFPVEKQPCN